jgi:predicted aspartyl protease
MRTYHYGKAADTYRLLLKKFETVLTPAERISYNNLAGLWGTLGNVGPQTVSIKGETVIQGTRDAAQLLNIPIELSGQKMDFIFDTGAGISTMTVSTAKKLGLQILEADVSVGSSTDISVKSKLAVAPELKIGDITARNVVFLVMEDKTLYVAPIKYQISAILGFPLIKSLRRVTLTRDNKVKINGPEGNRKEEPNMLLEGLKPLVAANYNNKRVIFALDTGANRTTFYPLLYSGSSESARAAAVSKTIRSGGAGGVQEVLGYKMKDVELSIGGKTAKFPEAEVLSDDKNERTAYYYGNLGQDLIKQYEKMTLDFVSMRLIFE